MSEENKAIVRRFVEEVQTRHNLDLADDFFDPNMVNHAVVPGLPDAGSATEQFKVFFALVVSAFPDIQAVIHSQVAEGDKVVTHKTFQGTHRGDFLGIPATGKRVEFDVIDIFRVVNGRLKEHWAVADMLGLMQQLGAASSPS